ncbi:MAG TPA: ABC transporter permease [Acidobacteriaceae bacterium]|jgi:ABC-type polysaccharide/polyol phosphate export permease|nr:ABC transporter permease [Acidobacteriaceae bacterium]
MNEDLRELYRYRELLYMFTYRDIRVRYKQSIMGLFWAVLMPILIVSAGIVVRYAYAVASHRPLNKADIASVAVKSLPWAFIVSSIRFSCSTLVANQNVVTKIYFPKEVFPLAAVLASLFDMTIASSAIVLFLLLVRIGWSLQLLWVPVLLMTLVILVTGIGMIISAASLFFRDVKYIVEVFLTFGIFFTPVLYDIQMLGHRGEWLMLNPLAPILNGFSDCIVRHQAPALYWLAYSLIFALTALVAGFVFFKHLEPAFAESI